MMIMMKMSLSHVGGPCISCDDISNVSKLQDLMDIFYYIRIKNTDIPCPVTSFLKEFHYIITSLKENTK